MVTVDEQTKRMLAQVEQGGGISGDVWPCAGKAFVRGCGGGMRSHL